MQKTRLIHVALFLVLLFTSLGPFPTSVQAAANADEASAASTVQLIVNNKTGAKVTLTLTGPSKYTLTINTGKNKVQVAPGKYKYSYKACDKTNTGNVKVQKSGDTLALAACPKTAAAGEKTVTVTINNKTGGGMTLVLSGPANYRFSLAPGTTKITVLPGKYNYTVYGCGGASKSGTQKLNAGFKWSWWCS